MLYRLPSKQNIVALSCDFWWVIGSYFKIYKHGYNLSASFCFKGKAKKEIKIALEVDLDINN